MLFTDGTENGSDVTSDLPPRARLDHDDRRGVHDDGRDEDSELRWHDTYPDADAQVTGVRVPKLSDES